MAQGPIILHTGAIARIPIRSRREFATRKIVFSDGGEQVFRDLDVPRRRYRINLKLMQGTERADCLEFYEAMKGGFESFTFLSPIDNLVAYSETFEETAAWDVSSLAAAADATADPFGLASNRVRKITVSSTPASLSQTLVTVAPGGSGGYRSHGLPLTLSCWVKRFDGSPPSFDLAFDDAIVDEEFSVSVTPGVNWARVTASGQFLSTNTSAETRIIFDNFSGAGSFYLFGAQLQLGRAVSGYNKTGAKSGVMTARFAEEAYEEELIAHDLYDLDGLEVVEVLP